MDPVAGAVKAARALRPAGRLAVFWNVFQPPREVANAFAAVYRRVMPDALSARLWTTGENGSAALCAKAAAGIREAGAFDDPEQWCFDWERCYTRDQWLDQLPTSGDAGQSPRPSSASS